MNALACDRSARGVDDLVAQHPLVCFRPCAALYEELLDAAPDGMVLIDAAGTIIWVNAKLMQQFGYAKDELLGRTLEILIPERFRAAHGGSRRSYQRRPHARAMGSRKHGEFVGRRKDGSEFPVDISLNATEGDGARMLWAAVRDVTEAYELSEQLRFQAMHDTLTGLVNRHTFEQHLRQRIDRAEIDGTEHVLCYLDLDQFKVVNDTCGHVAGDELLRRISQCLSEHTRQGDTVARLGGDEFAVLLGDCPVEHGTRIAEDIRVAIEALEFTWQGKRFSTGVSIGLFHLSGQSGTLAQVLAAVDHACYAAKENGRNRVHVYRTDDRELRKRAREMEWATRIEAALKEDRFHLYRQYIRPCAATADHGEHYEILVRMTDEAGHMVSPGAFLPAAERYQLSGKIDRWVVSTTLDWLGGARKHLDGLFLCSINLSGLTIGDRSFAEFVKEALRAHRVPAAKICFEITETAAISNLSSAAAFIESLRRVGCRFALDDFGSGLSSFAYLKNLPVDYLKIDGAFVKDIVDDPMDLAMTKCINEVAHILDKQTIAEFVENDAIAAALREVGVDFVQGFGIGLPEPVAHRD